MRYYLLSFLIIVAMTVTFVDSLKLLGGKRGGLLGGGLGGLGGGLGGLGGGIGGLGGGLGGGPCSQLCGGKKFGPCVRRCKKNLRHPGQGLYQQPLLGQQAILAQPPLLVQQPAYFG